jgi:hypothetical protein
MGLVVHLCRVGGRGFWVGQIHETTSPGSDWLFKGWPGLVVGLLTFCAWAVTLATTFDKTLQTDIFPPLALGSIGLSTDPVERQPGWERVSAVVPDGPAYRAGLAPGLRIRFDTPYESRANLAAGRLVGITVAQDGKTGMAKPRHVLLRAERPDMAGYSLRKRFGLITYQLAGWFSLLLASVVLVRGWGSATALVFALALLGYSADFTIPSWATSTGIATAFLVAEALIRSTVIGIFLLAFVAYAERVRAPGAGWNAIVLAIFGSGLALALWFVRCILQDVSFPLLGDGNQALGVLSLTCLPIGGYWAWRGRQDAMAIDRDRFVALQTSTGLWVMTVLFGLAAGLLSERLGPTAGFVAAMISVFFTNILMLLFMAYIALRHRVVDLGFAFNRTVVYGTFSAILLGSFGLIEWSIEHLLPEEWIKASAWIDAGAAVLVYLAFHRVHDAVEHRVEHLFFHQWQANEDALRRFVGSAAHFEDVRALARAFADELARFGGEAHVALYRRNEGVLDRVAGNWDTAPRHFRDDDPAFALLRAERAPLDLTETRTDLPGVLALPMLDHGALTGLVLLDLKGNGALYRPDEVALLGWAAHEVGLALAALQAGLIETENRLLKAQLARLGTIIGDRLDRAGA